jgi:GT2 family glycosyltransferase
MRSGRRGEWSAVIVNFNSAVLLDGCLTALYSGDLPPAEVVVVDNASTDDSLAELAAWPQVTLEPCPHNLGFAGGANRGIAMTETPLVLVLNPDVEVDSGFGRAVEAVFASQPRLGAVGAKLRYPNGQTIQHAGGIVHRPLLTTSHRGYGEVDQGQWDAPADVDFVTGGVLALRRSAFDQVGAFDESFWPAYYEDVDLCWRLRGVGWQVRYEPTLSATHIESVGLGRSLDYFRAFHRSRLRFALKHLTARDWREAFVPAEVDRLRGELSAIEDDDWPVRSGAQAIEELARLGGVAAGIPQGLLPGKPLAETVDAMTALRAARAAAETSLRAATGSRFSGRVRTALMRLVLGDIVWRQQSAIDALARLLDAQDRFNREQVSTQLLVLLDLIGREFGPDEPGNRPPLSEPGDEGIVRPVQQ